MGKGLTLILGEEAGEGRLRTFTAYALKQIFLITNAPETIKESADTNSTKIN